MNRKIKVAFIYKRNNPFLTGTHFDNTYYHFLMKALPNNQDVDVVNFPTGNEFDASVLKSKFDIILLWNNNPSELPEKILGIKDVGMPIISGVGDPEGVKRSIPCHDKWKIDYYYQYMPEQLFYDWGYPRDFKYKSIFFGLEASLYQNVRPFKKRIKNKILNSGAVGNLKFISRIINYVRNPKYNSLSCYKLRTKCNELSFVDYTSTLQHEFVGDKYPLLLQKYASAIAAGTVETAMKYWEIPAAGCLTFMEITTKNKGEYLGFKDGESSIFINESNYKQKFQQYMDEPDNPKWEKIAMMGRKHALQEFNNEKASQSLVKLMKDLLIKK